MQTYTGLKCPVCRKTFTDSDDIVVCPVCGAPYHRSCYEEKGSCIFEDLHKDGKEWTPPPDEHVIIKPSPVNRMVECLKCGTPNDPNSRICTNCGTLLPTNPKTSSYFIEQQQKRKYSDSLPPKQPSSADSAGNTPASFTPPPFGADPMGGVNPINQLDKNVTYGDASKIVRVRTEYYMPVFRYIKQTGRNKFNFSAFLFSGAWLLYRKQYGSGVFVTIVMIALQIVYQCALWLWADPTLEMLAKQAGLDLSSGAITNQQILTLSNLAAQDTWTYFKILSPVLVLLAILLVMIIVGVFGNKMYLRHCIDTVRDVQIAERLGEPDMDFQTLGGVNSMAALCGAICYSIVHSFLPLLFL